MKKIKLAVIFGGKSSEYPVSLHSVGSILHHLDRNVFDVTMIGITENGSWYAYEGTIEKIENDTWLQDGSTTEVTLACTEQSGFLKRFADGHTEWIEVDCLFPVLHGKNGEDGTIQGLFDLSGIPYVGCKTMSSAICMDKEMTHIIVENAGIACAPYVCIYERDIDNYHALFMSLHEKIKLPYFVKPCNAGSSFGVHKVRNEEEFAAAMVDAFYHDGKGKVIIEETIEGFEIGCAILGNEKLFLGECDEIETSADFFTYEGKYEMVDAAIICPARILDTTATEAKEIAKKAYRALNCSDLARVDMFVTPDRKIVFNEINTIPGFTATSRYPSMMKAAGIEFKDLLYRLVVNTLGESHATK